MPNQPCPHVTPQMIAAGFTVCATCQKDPADAQQDRLTAAYAALAESLDRLSATAADEARACRRKRPAPNLDAVRAAIRDLDHAENDVDTATLDLSTARGADA